MTYKKALTGRSSEGFLVSCLRTANLFDNVGIRSLIAFSKSGALKLSCVGFVFSELKGSISELTGSISELPTHNLKIDQRWHQYKCTDLS